MPTEVDYDAYIDFEAARIALQNAIRQSDEEMARHVALAATPWSDGETQFVRDESVSGDRVYFAQTPQRGFRLPVGPARWGDLAWTTYRDLNAAPLANGEPLTPGTCHTCGATGPVVPRPCGTRECYSQVCIDLCVECTGSREDMRTLVDQDLERASRRLNLMLYGDGHGDAPARESVVLLNVDYPVTATEILAHADRSYSRSDHYRVTPGQCSCGFRSAFTADMQMHLSGEPSTYIDHPPRYWKLCECGESRLCRRVAMPQFQLTSWTTAEFDPTRTPTFTDIYLCDDCCQRRGIS